MSPTARTLNLLRNAGLTVQVVERWCPHSRRRIDLFNVIDVVAMDPKQVGLLGVQACAGSGHAARLAKVLAEPRARLWVACGNRLAVYSWAKRGARGQRKSWTPRIEEVYLGHFTEES